MNLLFKGVIFMFQPLIFQCVFHPACVMDTLLKPNKHKDQSKNNFKHSKLIGISAYIEKTNPGRFFHLGEKIYTPKKKRQIFRCLCLCRGH